MWRQTFDRMDNRSLTTKTLVSTNSTKIQDIARKSGAWVPFLRSKDLSGDTASSTDVVKNVLEWCQGESISFDIICLLQPTSPLRTSEHLDQSITKFISLRNSDKDTLISVKEVSNKCLWTLGIDETSGCLYNLFDFDLNNPRRQDLPSCYSPNGAIYISLVKGFDSFYDGKGIIPFIMHETSSLDVDSQEDLDLINEILLNQSGTH